MSSALVRDVLEPQSVVLMDVFCILYSVSRIPYSHIHSPSVHPGITNTRERIHMYVHLGTCILECNLPQHTYILYSTSNGLALICNRQRSNLTALG